MISAGKPKLEVKYSTLRNNLKMYLLTRRKVKQPRKSQMYRIVIMFVAKIKKTKAARIFTHRKRPRPRPKTT